MWDYLDYSLADFLLFSPSVYFRLFELYNTDVWPAQLASPVVGILFYYLARDGGKRQSRTISICFAAIWLWVGYAFHANRYTSINDWAVVLAWAFAAQAIVFMWSAAKSDPVRYKADTTLKGIAGSLLWFLAVFLYPVLAFATGRSWTGAEIFGFAPDPTTIATFGLALFATRSAGWLLVPIPVALSIASGFTAVAMGSHALLLVSIVGIGTAGLMITTSSR